MGLPRRLATRLLGKPRIPASSPRGTRMPDVRGLATGFQCTPARAGSIQGRSPCPLSRRAPGCTEWRQDGSPSAPQRSPQAGVRLGVGTPGRQPTRPQCLGIHRSLHRLGPGPARRLDGGRPRDTSGIPAFNQSLPVHRGEPSGRNRALANDGLRSGVFPHRVRMGCLVLAPKSPPDRLQSGGRFRLYAGHPGTDSPSPSNGHPRSHLEIRLARSGVRSAPHRDESMG